MPGCVGLNDTLTMPFFPDFTVLVIPGPEILTETPATVLLPLGHPHDDLLRLAVALQHLRYHGHRGANLRRRGRLRRVGGVTGAVTRVRAEAVLLLLSVSGVAVVTVTTFVFVPVVLTVALTVIETEAPAAMVPSEHERDDGCVVTTTQVPAVVVADTKITPTGAASATLTSAAGSGPLFVTTTV